MTAEVSTLMSVPGYRLLAMVLYERLASSSRAFTALMVLQQ
jgi:hypothetical protein